MPVVNPLAREVVFKVVYYGPGLGGKTTSLQYVHATARPEHRGKMVSLATPVDRTLYFDFLPVRVPGVRGSSVRLQLFTVPGQVYYNATRKLVLTGADGLVLVFDSQRARSDANLESLENLRENLAAHGRDLSTIPHIIQFNKRDLYDTAPIEELERQLNREGAPSFGTVAMTGEGIFESLEAITRAVLEDFERRIPESRGISAADLALPEGGLAEALRGFERREPETTPELRLSQLPETDPGEAAARAAMGDNLQRSAIASPPPPEMTAVVQPIPSPVLPPVMPVMEPVPPSVMAPVLPPEPVESLPREVFRPTGGPPTGASFELLWPLPERPLVREVELALGGGDHVRALGLVEQLISRALAGVAAAFGTHEAPRDPVTVALVLGIDSRRYLEFRALAREARAGRGITAVEALGAYALAMQVRLARATIAG
ncbi:MAG TPA: gliding motility protein [Polyangiaceae bacterium]|nr:gliding motility protein [Polyangiaceae bacterium]